MLLVGLISVREKVSFRDFSLFVEKTKNLAIIKLLGCVAMRGSSSLLIGFGCTVMAISALPVGAQAVREGTFVAPAAQDNKVDVYTLPDKMQTVLVGEEQGRPKGLYAVGYYITTNDNAGAHRMALVEQWVTDENLSKFFLFGWMIRHWPSSCPRVMRFLRTSKVYWEAIVRMFVTGYKCDGLVPEWRQ